MLEKKTKPKKKTESVVDERSTMGTYKQSLDRQIKLVFPVPLKASPVPHTNLCHRWHRYSEYTTGEGGAYSHHSNKVILQLVRLLLHIPVLTAIMHSYK